MERGVRPRPQTTAVIRLFSAEWIRFGCGKDLGGVGQRELVSAAADGSSEGQTSISGGRATALTKNTRVTGTPRSGQPPRSFAGPISRAQVAHAVGLARLLGPAASANYRPLLMPSLLSAFLDTIIVAFRDLRGNLPVLLGYRARLRAGVMPLYEWQLPGGGPLGIGRADGGSSTATNPTTAGPTTAGSTTRRAGRRGGLTRRRGRAAVERDRVAR